MQETMGLSGTTGLYRQKPPSSCRGGFWGGGGSGVATPPPPKSISVHSPAYYIIMCRAH